MEYVEMWQDRLRRLEAREEGFKLAPVFEINWRALMAGEGYLDFWETDRDTAETATPYEELLGKVKG